MRQSFLKRCYEPFLNLVLPERCRLCNGFLPLHGPGGICSCCLGSIVYMGSAVCRRCGGLLRSSVAGGSLCGDCLRREPPWDQARSVVRYGPELRRLVVRLKYQADSTVLPALATIVNGAPTPFDRPWDFVLPVPMHRARLRRRGLNQAICIARILFPEQLGAINPFLLQRNRATAPQAGLDGRERRKNLKGAFQLSDPRAIAGARVVIVDDVFTTGSTVTECARVLRRAGAAEIGVVTLARVVVGD